MSIPDRISFVGDLIDPEAVDISRGSPWWNPWEVKLINKGYYAADEFRKVGPFDSYDFAYAMALAKFQQYCRTILITVPTWMDPLKKAKRLACRCGQRQRCHGDILIKLLKEMEEK